MQDVDFEKRHLALLHSTAPAALVKTIFVNCKNYKITENLLINIDNRQSTIDNRQFKLH